VKIRERCACGGEIEADGEAPATAVRSWREEHACDRRPPPRDAALDAYVEHAPPTPPVLGFVPEPAT
jgi:hypothetical protein